MAMPKDVIDVKGAIACLREARRLLRLANAPKAAAKVQRALKSAEGAERNAWARQYREDRHA